MNESRRPERILISGGTVLTMTDDVGDVSEWDVLVEGDSIAAVEPSLAVDDALVVDATGMIVVPGLSDTHRHTWQSTLHGLGPDWVEAEYLAAMRNSLGPNYRPDDLYTATLLGAAECINSGVTTLLDWAHLMNTPEHADASVQALRDGKIRAVFAYGNSNAGFQLPNDLRLDEADAARVRDEHFSGNQGLLSMAVALRGPDYSSIDVSRDDFNAARRLGLPITVHVGSNGTYGESVKRLAEQDLLGPDVTYVHCNTTTDEEMALIAESGGTVSVSPEAEMHLGCGLPPIGRLVEHGLRPSISTDVPSVVSMDMFGAMRVLIATHRGMVGQQRIDAPDQPTAPRLTTRDLLTFATTEGARTNGMGDHVGTIAPGMQADLTLISTRALGMFPVNNPSAAVVLAATPADVDTVLVAGRFVKRSGCLVDLDVDNLRTRAARSLEHLLDAGGISEAVQTSSRTAEGTA